MIAIISRKKELLYIPMPPLSGAHCAFSKELKNALQNSRLFLAIGLDEMSFQAHTILAQ